MPNQNDFDRITRIVVTPLTAFYGSKFPEAMVEAIVEDLASYSDDTLKAAVLDVRRTCKTTPRIATLVEACGKCKPASVQQEPKRNGFHCAGKCENERPDIAREILTSPEGRRALELGVSSALLIEYECTGRKEFDERFLMRAKEARTDAAEAVRNLSPENPMYQAFHAMYEAMEAREKELHRRFAA